jgi:hypothetical protein
MKAKPKSKTRQEPLADGQVWNMADSSLRVDLVGNLLVHYKLGKHNAVRVSNSIGTKSNIENFLRKNKAVLLKGAKAATAKQPAAAKKNSAANK